MQTVLRFFWGHMLAATAAFAIGYALAGQWIISLVIVFLGAVWFAAQARGASAVGSLLLYVLVLSGLVPLWAGYPAWLLLTGTVAGLGAWDLDHFLHRLSAVDQVNMESGLGKLHIRRLLLIEGVGMLVGLVALVIQARISFGWVVLLVLLAIFSLTRLITFIRKQET